MKITINLLLAMITLSMESMQAMFLMIPHSCKVKRADWVLGRRVQHFR